MATKTSSEQLDPTNLEQIRPIWKRVVRKKPFVAKDGFACPYRVRNRRRFNVRDHPSCALEKFETIAQVKKHIISHHACSPSPPSTSLSEEVTAAKGLKNEARDPEDGMVFSTADLESIEPRTWQALWNWVFPKTDVICQGFVAPIEHFELAQTQEEFLTTHVKSAETDLPPQVVSFLHQILRKFVQETVASVVSGGLEEPKFEAPSKELPTSEVKVEFLEAKKLSVPENSNPRNLTQREFEKDLKSTYNSTCDQLELYYTALFNEHPPKDKDGDVEQTPARLAGTQAASAISSLAATPQSGSETTESTQDAKMRQILDFSYRVLFDTGLDTLAFVGPFALDNLMEVTEDFTNQLASVINPVSHLQKTPMEASNVSFTASSSGSTSGLGPPGRSEKAGSSSGGGGGSGRGSGNPGDGKSPRGMEAPGKPGPFRPASRFRFPCPFRMKDPFTFNVREYYSCSMTFFSDLKSLKEHLRRCHRRQDKAEVACSRCLAGFRTRNERDEHQRTGELCEVKDLRASLKLGLEEEILSKRPSKINVPAEEQWEELCQSVLRSANVKISPEYRPVMEHFEFARLLFQSIPSLVGLLYGETIRDRPNIAAILEDFFVKKMDDFELGRKESPSYRSSRKMDFQIHFVEGHYVDILDDHFESLLHRSDEIIRTIPYTNNQSRGQGNSGSRRLAAAITDPDMLTPQSTTTTGTPRPISDWPEVCERRAKRPRLAPRVETGFAVNLTPGNTAPSLAIGQPTNLVDTDSNLPLEQAAPGPSANADDEDFSYLFYGMSSGFQECSFDLTDILSDETAIPLGFLVSEEVVPEGSTRP